MWGDSRLEGSLFRGVLINFPFSRMECGESLCARDDEEMVFFTLS